MEIYVLLIVVLSFYWLCESKNFKLINDVETVNGFNKIEKNRKNILFVLFFLLFVIVFAFRNAITGTDTHNYISMINDRNMNDVNYSMEFLFWYIIDIGLFLGLSPSCCLCLIGALSFCGIIIVIKKHSKSPAISLFFFFCLGIYTSSFNGMRQFLALSFFMLAIDSLMSNRLLNYFVFCALAFFSHNSAIVLFPIFLVKYIKLNWKTLVVFVGISLGGIFALPHLVKFVSRFTRRDYYSYYIKSNLFAGEVSLYNLCYLIGLVCVFVWFYYVRYKIPHKDERKKYDFLLTLFLVNVCIRFIATFSGFFMLVNRFTVFFFWTIVLLIPYTIIYFSFKRITKYYSLIIYCGGIIYFLISSVVMKSNNVVPYKFIYEVGSFNYFLIIILIMVLVLSIIYFSYTRERKSRFYGR